MPQINQLSSVDTLSVSDLLPLFSQQNGDARKTSLANLSAFIQSNITVADDKITQYAAPSATDFTVQVLDTGDNIWLVLTPLAGYADGTITLPTVANCLDKQEILVNCTQDVTTLVVSANGASIAGQPLTLAANDFFRLRFEGVTKTWYRVG